jgi:hypothetical protein
MDWEYAGQRGKNAVDARKEMPAEVPRKNPATTNQKGVPIRNKILFQQQMHLTPQK